MRYEDRRKRKCIGLISATRRESQYLLRKIDGATKTGIRQLSVFRGSLSGGEIIAVSSGIGKTNASHAATVLARDYAPACIVNFGIGGAFPSSGLEIGDIAVAEKEVYGDEGFLDSSGFKGMESAGFPLLSKGGRKYFNEFPLDRGLREKAVASVRRICNVRTGTFLTVSTCTGTRRKARELKKKFDPLCENMEGAAIAHICTIYGIPMVEIRGISNIVEDRDISQWDVSLASKNCQRSVAELLYVL